jgi:hypothetical protein
MALAVMHEQYQKVQAVLDINELDMRMECKRN